MRPCGKCRGTAFVLVIAILAAMVAILAGAAATRRVEFRSQTSRMNRERARLLAEGGIRFALAALSAQDPNLVDQTNDWYQFATPGDQGFKVDGGQFRIELIDDSGFVNLNSASEEQLLAIGMTTEEIDSLLDWREDGQTARPEGAKDQYYNDLAEPYNAKLRSLDSVDELLLIKGFNAQRVYQYQPNQSSTGGASAAIEAGQLSLYDLATTDSQSPNNDAAGQQKGNINQAGTQTLVSKGVPAAVAAQVRGSRPAGGYTTMKQVLAVQAVTAQAAGTILDNFIVGTAPNSNGKLNVNTASEAALLTLPGITSDVVSNILSRQSSGYTNLSELATTPGITIANLRQWGDQVTISSNTFRVRALGKVGTSIACLEGLVRLGGASPQIVRVWETPESDMRVRWGWSDEASNEVTLSERND